MKRQYIPLVAFSFLFSLSAQTDARSYPLQEITPTKCVGEDCTLPLPTIQNADYFTYRNLPTYRSTYSMLWLSTYFGGRDVGIGSHQGIDIVTKT
ncbi:MAG: hypothetical protein LBD11_04710 [Candidatus Peribacteria bacterium]|jgi:hypothetical protein|nr:hypothetical protein [Candidatus Peribacteria bacterium]